MQKTTIRYSEAFKLQVVSELEAGQISCILQARQRYGIRGCGTIERWLKQYGKNHLLNKVVRVEKPGEKDEVNALKKRIRDLERALADTQIDGALDRAYFQVLCEDAGIEDVEGYKKKLASEVSKRRK